MIEASKKTLFDCILDPENLSPLSLPKLIHIFRFVFLKTKAKINIRSQKSITLSDPAEIQEVITWFHDSPVGGHQGRNRTLQRLQAYYSWPHMSKDIDNYVKSCPVCQTVKPHGATKAPLTITTTAKSPFERLAIDLVGPLPPSGNENYVYILTAQCDLTKFL